MKKKILLVTQALFLASVGCLCAAAQEPILTLQNTANGFTGEYGTGAARILVEYSRVSDVQTVSKIKDASNQILAESSRNDNVIVDIC